MPCAESVRVPSRSKITNCGRAARDGVIQWSSRVHCLRAAHYCRDVASRTRAAARYHGDQAAGPGMLDFAVNVRAARAAVLAGRAAGVAACGPGPLPERRRRTAGTSTPWPPGTAAAATRWRCWPGPPRGSHCWPTWRPRLAALIAPSFTEPEAALAAAGVALRHVVLAPPFDLAGAVVARRSRSRRRRQSDQSDRGAAYPASRSSRCAGRVASWWSTRRSPTPFPASRESLAGRRAARRGGAAQPDQDVGAGRAAGRLRAGRTRRAANG